MAKRLVQHVTRRPGGLIAVEAVLITASVAAAAYAALGERVWTVVQPEHALLKVILIASVCQLCLYYVDRSDEAQVGVARRELLVGMFRSLGVASAVLAAVYFWFPSVMIAPGVFATATGIVAAVVVCWRLGCVWMRGQIGPRERLLLLGTSATAVTLAHELEQRGDLRVQIVGFIDADEGERRSGDPEVLGTIEDIPAIVRARSVDRVVVSVSDARGKLPMDKLLDMKLGGVTFDHLTSVYEDYIGKIAVEHLRRSSLIFAEGFHKSRAQTLVKRGIDIGAAVIGLLVAWPVLLAVAAAIRVSSGRPVLYCQRRVGRDGRIFTLFKFRSMRPDAEAATGAVWAREGDERITAIGRFLRRTRLDELPQLWNVLVGDMSVVGPRPERPEFVQSLTRQIPFYGQRHIIKPGLTGWAQVRYKYASSTEDSLEKLRYDLFYVKNLSIRLDLLILFETVKIVFRQRGH